MAPHVSVTPSSGPQGTTFSEPGTGFTPNGGVTLHFKNPSGIEQTTVSKTADASGGYSHTWGSTSANPAGTWQYWAVDNTSGVSSNIANISLTASSVSGANWTPFYRLYNSSIKDHFYTTSSTERDDIANKGFLYERIEGFVSSTSFTGTVPLYRYYNSAKDVHYYSTNASDSTISSGGYAFENAYYIYPTQQEWTSPLYYASHATNTDNFYTTSWYEYQNAIKSWKFTGNGIIGYVATKIANNRPQGNFAGVGMASGNFSLPSFTDLSLSGAIGPQLSLTRYYDSYSPGTSLGQGWSFNYDSYISIDPADNSIHVEWGNGSESHFFSSLTPYPGYFDKIAVNGNGYNITTKDQTVYTFSQNVNISSGPNILLTAVTDKFGNTLTLTRNNPYGLVTKATDATGRSFDFQYMTFSVVRGTENVSIQRLQQVTDNTLSPPRVVKFSYFGTNGNLFDVTDARGNITKYTYNADGMLSTITYPEGNTVNVTYDLLGRATGYTNGSISLTFDYNASTGTTVKNGTSALVNFLPDSQKRASVITYAGVAADYSQPTYCTGNLLNQTCTVRDRNGNTTTYTYDANGNVLTVKNALNETTTFTYDALGKNNLTSVKDPRNNTTTYGYDASYLKLLSVTKPMGGITTYSGYTANGLVGTVTDPTGHSITYTYGDNRHYFPTKIADNALSTSLDYTYDGAGRRQTQTDQQRPTSQLTTWIYDNNDNVTSVQINTNPAAVFRYDKNNRVYNVVDPKGKTTVYTYNTMNLLYTQQSPDLKTWTYNYDSVGNISYVDLPDSSRINYTYYPNNRLQYIRQGSTEKLYYTYDNNGNVLSVRANGSTTTGFAYNTANRVTSITDPFGNVIGYGYDAAGNRTSINYPGSKVVNYTFDADNRLSTVKDWLGTATTTYGYNTAGILQSITNANGTTTSFTYDTANRLKTLANKKSNLSVISDYSLSLDNVGNPYSIVRNEPLAPPIPAMADITYGYNDAHQILNAGSTTYTHDNLGNLQTSSNGKNFTFDYANRMTGATIGADTFSFAYDAFGNRISRTKNGTQTKYLLDLNAGMSNVLAETNSAGVVQNYYVHGLGLISRIDNAGLRFTYHYDQLGNTIAVTDDSNIVTESYTYDEFGSKLASSGTAANPFKFVGRYGVMDEENGLLYMRARYYDADNGRFISRDPLGFGGEDLNLYAYVGGNPLMGIDPTGLADTNKTSSNKAGSKKSTKKAAQKTKVAKSTPPAPKSVPAKAPAPAPTKAPTPAPAQVPASTPQTQRKNTNDVNREEFVANENKRQADWQVVDNLFDATEAFFKVVNDVTCPVVNAAALAHPEIEAVAILGNACDIAGYIGEASEATSNPTPYFPPGTTVQIQ